MTDEIRPVIGSEALRDGRLNLHALRTRHQLLLPDVYLAGDEAPTLWQRTVAAWLWSHREGVIAGPAAAALHGAKWVDEDTPVDLIWTNARAPRGVRTSDARLRAAEYQLLDGMRVTTPVRTAYDTGRRKPVKSAVAQLDALAAATSLKVEQVYALAEQHRGARGIRTLRHALDLVDPGAQSPQETRVRLLLIDAGFPRPRTQIPVFDPLEKRWYYIDMGWDDLKVGIEYEGDYHRTDRRRYVSDIRKRDALTRQGWRIVWVVAEDRNADIVGRTRYARETTR